MELKKGLRFESKEALGHQIETKVAEFMSVVFDCVKNIERTNHDGVNDKKGVDFVVAFEDGSKLAIDVTANKGPKFEDKIKSMSRNLMTSIDQELNSDGETTVEKSKTLVPRALLRVDSVRWEGYDSEKVDQEIILHINENDEVREKRDIINQLLRQMKHFSKEDKDYGGATATIREALGQELN